MGLFPVPGGLQKSPLPSQPVSRGLWLVLATAICLHLHTEPQNMNLEPIGVYAHIAGVCSRYIDSFTHLLPLCAQFTAGQWLKNHDQSPQADETPIHSWPVCVWMGKWKPFASVSRLFSPIGLLCIPIIDVLSNLRAGMEFTGCSGLCGICCTRGLPHSASWSHDCNLGKMELMTVPSHYPQTLWSQIRSTAQHSKLREPPLTAVVSRDTSSQDSSWQLNWTSTREDLLRFLFLDSSINSPEQALLSLLNAFSLQSADLFAFLPQRKGCC